MTATLRAIARAACAVLVGIAPPAVAAMATVATIATIATVAAAPVPVAAIAPPSTHPEAAAPSPAFTGWFLSWSAHGADQSFSTDDRATPVPDDFDYEDTGGGMDFGLGYAFSPQFEIEFSGGGTAFETVPKDTYVISLDAGITGYLPVRSAWRVHPVLIAGFGVTAIAWSSDDFTDRLYLTGRGDLGAGLRVRVTRRFRVHAEFVYSTHDVERELLNPEEEDGELRHVDGSAFTRTVRAGVAWDL